MNKLINKSDFPTPIIDYDVFQIKTNVPDLYSLIGRKTLDAFEISVNELDFDFIYRTNVSSYVDLAKLNEFIQNKPLSNYYSGAIGNHQGISFASGCGYFISRDLVIKILENKELWNHDLIDDVSVGKLMTKHFEVGIEEVMRIDIDSVDSVSSKIRNGNRETFHYRCKARTAGETIQIMTQIHNMILKENNK